MKNANHSSFLLSSTSLRVQLILVHLVMKARLALKHAKGIPVALLKSQSSSLTQPSAACKQIIALPGLRGLGWGSAQGVFLKVAEASVLQEPYARRWLLVLLNPLELCRAQSGPAAPSQRGRRGPHLSGTWALHAITKQMIGGERLAGDVGGKTQNMKKKYSSTCHQTFLSKTNLCVIWPLSSLSLYPADIFSLLEIWCVVFLSVRREKIIWFYRYAAAAVNTAS